MGVVETQALTRTGVLVIYCTSVVELSWAQIVFVGLRDIDKHERRILRDLGIQAYTMYHIDRFGIGGVMEHALEHLKGRPLHMR